MQFELRKYNIHIVKKVLESVKGKSIVINEISLYGVESIDIEESEMYDCDPIPEEGYGGGKRELINLTFNFKNGTAMYSFCPDEQHCEISFEMDDLWVFTIESIEKWADKEKEYIDFRLKDYKEYMSK